MVRAMQEAQRQESMQRGRILREAANLHARAVRRRADEAWRLMERSAPWMIEDPWAEVPAETTARRFAVTEAEVRRREAAVNATFHEDPTTDCVERDVAAEISVALMLPSGTARALLEDALTLSRDLPEVLAALESGEITWDRVRTILKQWGALAPAAPVMLPADRGKDFTATPERIDQIDAQAHDQARERTAAANLAADMLDRAAHVTVAQLGEFGRRRRAAAGSQAQSQACAAARKNRDVWVEHAEDGLSYLHALVESGKASAIRDRIAVMARTCSKGERNVGEVRADALCDLLLDAQPTEDSGFPRGVRGQVSVVVPVGVLIRCDPSLKVPDGSAELPVSPDGPQPKSGDPVPELVGYGPIDTEQAVELAATATSWRRILTDPGSGEVLSYGRETYTVPTGLREMLRVRDQTCRFPGCRRSVQTSDIDHTVAWEDGGTTDPENLAHLCRYHHRVKHVGNSLGQWSVRQVRSGDLSEASESSGGTLEWVSPTGVVRRTVPERVDTVVVTSADPPPF